MLLKIAPGITKVTGLVCITTSVVTCDEGYEPVRNESFSSSDSACVLISKIKKKPYIWHSQNIYTCILHEILLNIANSK